ncbi:MAG: DNA/RNA helicase domain-containing protein [Ruminococcus sp.]
MPKPCSIDYSISRSFFDQRKELDEEIRKLAGIKEESSLSRLIATYDWEYNAKTDPTERLSKYWEVLINGWHKPWNVRRTGI